LPFENPHDVPSDESLLACVAHQSDGCLGDVKRVLAPRANLDDVEGMATTAELDP
jgi:hypothetical protein